MDVLQHHLHRRVALEDQLASQQIVGNTSQGVDVGPPIDVCFAEDDLRRHIGRCAGRDVVQCQKGALRIGGSAHLDEAEVQNLDEVVLEPHAADVDIGRLDVAMNKSACVRVGQGMADLAEQEHCAVRGHRPELAHERLQIATGEELHDVVERSIAGRTVVEDLNRVRRAERRRGLRFALEPSKEQPRLAVAGRPEQRWPDQLDGGVSGEELVTRAPDFAHAALPEQLDQLVAAELLRFAQPVSQPMEEMTRHHGDDGAGVVGKKEDERLRSRRNLEADDMGDPHAERIHRGRHQ